ITQLLPFRESGPLWAGRRVEELIRYFPGTGPLALQAAGRLGELPQACRIGPMPRVERLFVVRVAHRFPFFFSFALYDRSARRRHLVTSFCVYFTFKPYWSAISWMLHPLKYRRNSTSWQRGSRHSSTSRAASWLGRLSSMFCVAGSTRSNSCSS